MAGLILLGLAGCAEPSTEDSDADESSGASDSGSESESGESESGSETESGSESESGESETGETGDEQPVYPEPDWVPGSPEQHGLDAAALEAAAALAEDAGSGCLLITRHGVIVGEWYWDGWAQGTQTPVFSVTKSITSALAGIAASEELLEIDDWASDHVELCLRSGRQRGDVRRRDGVLSRSRAIRLSVP